MATARQFVHAILQEVLVQTDQQSIEPPDADAAMFAMNNFMAEISADKGIAIGYTEVSTLADDITIPTGANNGLIFGTAQKLVSSFDIIPNIQLTINAKSGLSAMLKLSRVKRATKLPSTLPVGTGNKNGFGNDRFFPGDSDSILNTTGGKILLEDGT